MKIVGKYKRRFNTLTGQNIKCTEIYQSDGLIKHVQKRHPEDVNLIEHIGEIINSPDYVGKNPKESNSVELVKRLNNNAMVCIKLDTKNDYLFVASVFSITDKKLSSRICSGRLKPFVDKKSK